MQDELLLVTRDVITLSTCRNFSLTDYGHANQDAVKTIDDHAAAWGKTKAALKKKHKVSVKPSKILLQLQIQALLPFFSPLLTSLVSTTSRIASFDIKKKGKIANQQQRHLPHSPCRHKQSFFFQPLLSSNKDTTQNQKPIMRCHNSVLSSEHLNAL